MKKIQHPKYKFSKPELTDIKVLLHKRWETDRKAKKPSLPLQEPVRRSLPQMNEKWVLL